MKSVHSTALQFLTEQAAGPINAELDLEMFGTRGMFFQYRMNRPVQARKIPVNAIKDRARMKLNLAAGTSVKVEVKLDKYTFELIPVCFG